MFFFFFYFVPKEMEIKCNAMSKNDLLALLAVWFKPNSEARQPHDLPKRYLLSNEYVIRNLQWLQFMPTKHENNVVRFVNR